jgi:hypothetical protein
MRTRLGLIAGTTVLVGIGVFFAVAGTGTAGQYATIGSFFLAVPVAAAAIIAIAQAGSEGGATNEAEENPTKPPSNSQRAAWGNKVVQQGDHAVAHVDITYNSPMPRHPREKRRND